MRELFPGERLPTHTGTAQPLPPASGFLCTQLPPGLNPHQGPPPAGASRRCHLAGHSCLSLRDSPWATGRTTCGGLPSDRNSGKGDTVSGPLSGRINHHCPGKDKGNAWVALEAPRTGTWRLTLTCAGWWSRAPLGVSSQLPSLVTTTGQPPPRREPARGVSRRTPREESRAYCTPRNNPGHRR